VDGEGLALASKGKGKTKKKGSKSGAGGKKKNIDFSKVKCFIYHKLRYFSSQCPEKKKSKPQMATSVGVEEFCKSFDEYFCLVACMSSSLAPSVWYVDNGASCHMTGHKEFFNKLQEGGVNLHIELGNDARYKAQGIGTMMFQREFGKFLRFIDVLYVPGLTKNLISTSTLEDKGFEVTFRGGKVYIRLKGSTAKMDKVIGVRNEKVYKLQVESTKALVKVSHIWEKLWHGRMVHPHHGAFGHLR
jgi:hypothetical protein